MRASSDRRHAGEQQQKRQRNIRHHQLLVLHGGSVFVKAPMNCCDGFGGGLMADTGFFALHGFTLAVAALVVSLTMVEWTVVVVWVSLWRLRHGGSRVEETSQL